MHGMELPLCTDSSSDVDDGCPTAPISRLQMMQARFQSKLLREKELKMLQMYPEASHAPNGGSVRQFFALRRAQQASSGGGVALNGLQQSLNGSWSSGTFARQSNHPPKHGSPVGWDKSYPLSPLDRDARDSASGPYLGSFSTRNGLDRSGPKPAAPPATGPNRRRLEVPAAKKADRRAPSLDRRRIAAPNAGMRRSNSQILAASTNGEKENEPRAPPAKTPSKPQKKPEAQRAPNGLRKPRPAAAPAAVSPTQAAKAPQPAKDQRDSGGSPQGSSTPKAKKPLVPTISYNSPPKPSSPAAPKQPSRTTPTRRAPASAVDPNLIECAICGRHFALDRIDKHKTICEKTTTKKRKVFDPTKMRMKGTELEEFARKSAKSGQRTKEPPTPKKADWRQKRNAFIETIRQAKVVQRHMAAGGKASDLPPPPPMDTSDYILCPHCGRKFSEAAAERHIPKCKNIKSNKKSGF